MPTAIVEVRLARQRHLLLLSHHHHAVCRIGMSADCLNGSQPYAVVTVVDAFEGDAWVADLRVTKEHTKLTSWNRFIIDTGPAHKVVASARGGPRLGLYRALFDEEPIKEQKHSKIDLPWQRDLPWKPKICGVIITHTDQDHWGNARWLVDLIRRHLSEPLKPLPAVNPLSVYTSPMVQWAIDLQVTARAKSGFVAGNAAYEDEDEDEDQPAAGGVDEDDEEDLSVGVDDPPPYCGLRKDRRQHINITVIDNKTYLEARKAYINDKNETRNGKSWLKWLESLAKKPSPILPGCKVIELEVDKSVRCMWNHRPHRLHPSISAGFRDVIELADNLGYELQYRFNIWRDKPPEDVLIDAHKQQARPANHEKRPTLEKWQYMHQTLPDAWLNQNVVQPLGTWSRKNFLNIPNQYDGKKVRILAEARLVPPRRSAKRSYHTTATELNQIIGGYWLRVSQEFDLGDKEVDDMSQSSQISSLTEMMEEAIQRNENNEATIEMLTEEEKEERRQRAAQKTAHEIMDRADEDPRPQFRENPKCLGYQDKSYSMQYDVEQPSLWPTESLYKESYMGSAGTRFSRDFLHLAVQRFLSHAANEPWYQRAVLDGAMAQDQNLQDLKAALAETREVVVKLQKVSANNRTPQQIQEIENKKLERSAADTKFKAAKKRYDDKKATCKKKIEAAKHSSWGPAANRASLITHFRFHADWSMVPWKFDMLFTGDAFEAGSKDSGPYAPHFKPSDTDFSAAWAARPRTIEMPDEGYMANPDGNLLGWLWQHSALKPLRVGVLKLPHHGSSKTTSNLFYRLVSASVYLVSGSNSKFGHPKPETLASIVETIMREDGPAKPPRQYRSVLNNLPKTYKDKEGKEFFTPVIYEVCSSCVVAPFGFRFRLSSSLTRRQHNHSDPAHASSSSHGAPARKDAQRPRKRRT